MSLEFLSGLTGLACLGITLFTIAIVYNTIVKWNRRISITYKLFSLVTLTFMSSYSVISAITDIYILLK
jgi:hypothetical protein